MKEEESKSLLAKLKKLNIDFRKGPIYQWFRETGPLEGFAILQTQASVININTKIVGVFLFKDEADMAKEYMESSVKNTTLSFTVMPTKITRYKGF